MSLVSDLQESCRVSEEDELDPGIDVPKGFKVSRKPYSVALEFAEKMASYWTELGIQRENIYFGGSLRRKKATVGDLDIVVNDISINAASYRKFNDKLHEKGHKVAVRVLGASHFSVLIDNFLVEFKRSEPKYLGAMLLFVTGPGDYNMAMRGYAKSLGMALNQYGLHDRDSQRVIASTREEDIFAALGVPYVLPEQRLHFNPPARTNTIPSDILSKLPSTVRQQLKGFVLPDKDLNGKPIPPDFLWNKDSRQQFYRRGGRFNVPDGLKLDKYQ